MLLSSDTFNLGCGTARLPPSHMNPFSDNRNATFQLDPMPHPVQPPVFPHKSPIQALTQDGIPQSGYSPLGARWVCPVGHAQQPIAAQPVYHTLRQLHGPILDTGFALRGGGGGVLLPEDTESALTNAREHRDYANDLIDPMTRLNWIDERRHWNED